MTPSTNSRRRFTHALTTFAPTTLVVLATAFALYGYDNHLHENLHAARLLALWGSFAVSVLIPIWTAIRAKRAWLVTLLPQVGMLGVQLLLTFALVVKTPHGATPPTCGTPAAMMFMSMALGYLFYCAAAIPITAAIEHFRRRRANS